LANFKKIQIRIFIFICQLPSNGHTKFQLSPCYSDRFRQIFDHFSRKYQFFPRKFQSFLSKFQKSQILCTHLYLSISNASPASTQMDFDKCLTFFQGKFKIFLKEIQIFPSLKKVLNNFPKGNFYQILNHLAFFQNFQK
jgi:hypothetical protein